MSRVALLAFLSLGACGNAAEAPVPASACSEQGFEGSRFIACSQRRGAIEVRTASRNGLPYRSFAALEAALGSRSSPIAFAMNAGMFDEAGRPIGLLVEDGKQVHAINLRKGGGNFHLLPNGVFLVRDDGTSAIVTSPAYKSSKHVRFATQSGPMLVIAGRLHPKFDADGESRNIRNGVGMVPGGTPIFVISEDPVSFGKFARFFRDGLRVRDALYFDGAVSALWDPANGRRDNHSPLGPMVVVFRPAESAPGRASHARP